MANRKLIGNKVGKGLAALFALTTAFALSPLSFTAPDTAWADDPSIPIVKTINASKAVETSGMQFSYAFAPGTPNASAGESPVPRYDSNNDGSITDADAFVAPATKVLTAAAMPGDVQTISDTIALPNPALFGHAGIYVYTVSEDRSAVPAGWTYSDEVYTVRLYVVNGSSGLEYAATPATMEKSSGDKADALAFTNQNNATSSIEVGSEVAGAYADQSKAFPVTLALTLPSWASDGQFAFQTSGSNVGGSVFDDGSKVVTSNGLATVTLDLAHGQTIKVDGLPVGTRVSVTEAASTDYAPTGAYFFDGLDGASSGYGDNTIEFATGDNNTVVISATGETPNASTIVGAGPANRASITNTLVHEPTPTGIITTAAPYAILFGICAAVLALVVYRRRYA